jgi:hypothetical protein
VAKYEEPEITLESLKRKLIELSKTVETLRKSVNQMGSDLKMLRELHEEFAFG